MSDMPNHPRLTKRGNVYWHRAAIPADIKGTYPKSEETFSLKTSDPSEALRRVRVASVEVDQKFEQHRKSLKRAAVAELTDAQIKSIGDQYYAMLLEEDEDTRLSQFDGTSFEEHAETSDALDGHNRHGFARGQVDEFFKGEVDEVLSWEGVNTDLPPDSNSRLKLARELQARTIAAAEVTRRRNKGDVVETPKPPAETTSRGPLLSVAVPEWVDEKSRSAWVPKVRAEHEVWMKHFVSVVGDRPLMTYGKADGRKFKDVLTKLPPNWNKQRALKELPIELAATKARTLDMPRMAEANINKIMYGLSGFFSWAADNYEGVDRDIFKGLRLKGKTKARDQRDPFTTSELQTIFTAPIYSGCKSERFWKERGPLIQRESSRYWVPLLGLFTGARMGELLQLYVDDVKKERGVHYLRLSPEGDDQRIKTKHARVVPVHKKLIELGFLKFVEAQKRRKVKRLFPDAPMGADGYYSSPFSKFFNANFLPSLGIKKRKNAFHSFRHTFEDACRAGGVEMGARFAIVGHAEPGQGARYGGSDRSYSVAALNQEIQKVAYPTLRLGHLRAKR